VAYLKAEIERLRETNAGLNAGLQQVVEERHQIEDENSGLRETVKRFETAAAPKSGSSVFDGCGW
jgi:FtsZ-binding cell division protein ZapB